MIRRFAVALADLGRDLLPALLVVTVALSMLSACKTNSLTPSPTGAAGYTVAFRIETGDTSGHPASRIVGLLSIAVQDDQQIALRRPATADEQAYADWAEVPPASGHFELVPPGTGTHVRTPYTRNVTTPWVHNVDLGHGVVSASINATLAGQPGESVSCSAFVGGIYVDGSIRTAIIGANASAAEVACLHIY